MKKYDNVALVTGGAGFIGSAFLRLFTPQMSNWFFINLDCLTYAGSLENVIPIENLENYIFIEGNISDMKLVEEIFEDYKPNIVVNFAAESHVDNSIDDSKNFILTNVLGTHVLLEVARIKWADRNKDAFFRFVQISTDEVYGSLSKEQESFSESSGYYPNSPYSASKAAADLICRSYSKTYGLPIIITRSSNNFGPYQNSEKLIPKIINNALNDLLIPIYGDGTNIREWIFVDDNCNAIMKILLEGDIGEIYNIGGKTELSNLDITKIILDKLKKNYDLISFVRDRLGHDFRYSLNTSRLEMLGWRENTSFLEGLDLTLLFYQSQRMND
jgi:dTDP-glucose 4,6-dehydratase